MSRVWKYTLPLPNDVIELQMPEGAEPLMVAEQFDAPCLWVRVDPTRPTVTHRFRWAGTGHPLDDDFVGAHVGSWMQAGGALVWHLFTMPEEPR